MLTYNPAKRISAAEAVKHVWILRNTKRDTMATDNVLNTLESLKNFRATSMVQKAVMSYMVMHVISKGEEKRLREVFEVLDKNKDGQLSSEELVEGFTQVNGLSGPDARKEVARIMRTLDMNGNGAIDYNGSPAFPNSHRVPRGQHERNRLPQSREAQNRLRLLR